MIGSVNKAPERRANVLRHGTGKWLPMQDHPIPETTLAYMAGLFDGEGSVSLLRRSKRSPWAVRLHISICNTNEESMRTFSKGFDGSLFRQQRTGFKRYRRPWYIWSADDAKAERVLRLLLPYLKIKADRARIGLYAREVSAAAYKNRKGVSMDDATRAELARLREAVLALNRGEDVAQLLDAPLAPTRTDSPSQSDTQGQENGRAVAGSECAHEWIQLWVSNYSRINLTMCMGCGVLRRDGQILVPAAPTT